MSRNIGTQGSEIFGTNVVRADEYLLLAKVITEGGSSVEEASLEIECIDDMLSLQKIRAIHNSRRRTSKGNIRKDSTFLDVLSHRLDKLIQDKKQLSLDKK